LRNRHWLWRKERRRNSDWLRSNERRDYSCDTNVQIPRDEDRCCRDSIQSLNWLGISFLSLSACNNSASFSLCSLMSCQMFSAGSGNFGSLHNCDWCYERCRDRNFWSHWETKGSSSRGNRDVGGSHSKSVDIIRSVVNCLDNVVGINILVAASGNSEGVL